MAALQQHRCDGCGKVTEPWDAYREAGIMPDGWHAFEVKPLGGDVVIVDVCAGCWDGKPCSAVLPAHRNHQ